MLFAVFASHAASVAEPPFKGTSIRARTLGRGKPLPGRMLVRLPFPAPHGSHQEVVEHMARHVGKPEVAPTETVGEFFVIESQEV